MTPNEVEAKFKRDSSRLFASYGAIVSGTFERFEADRNRAQYNAGMAEARRMYLIEWEKIEGRYHSEMADAI